MRLGIVTGRYVKSLESSFSLINSFLRERERGRKGEKEEDPFPLGLGVPGAKIIPKMLEMARRLAAFRDRAGGGWLVGGRGGHGGVAKLSI